MSVIKYWLACTDYLTDPVMSFERSVEEPWPPNWDGRIHLHGELAHTLFLKEKESKVWGDGTEREETSELKSG